MSLEFFMPIELASSDSPKETNSSIASSPTRDGAYLSLLKMESSRTLSEHVLSSPHRQDTPVGSALNFQLNNAAPSPVWSQHWESPQKHSPIANELRNFSNDDESTTELSDLSGILPFRLEDKFNEAAGYSPTFEKPSSPLKGLFSKADRTASSSEEKMYDFDRPSTSVYNPVVGSPLPNLDRSSRGSNIGMVSPLPSMAPFSPAKDMILMTPVKVHHEQESSRYLDSFTSSEYKSSASNNNSYDEHDHYLRLVQIAPSNNGTASPHSGAQSPAAMKKTSPSITGTPSVNHMQSKPSTPIAHHSDPAAINGLINTYAQAGDKGMAVKYMELMMSELQMVPDIITLNAVINSHAQCADMEGAARYLDFMRYELGITPDSVSFGAMINACAQCADKDAAVHYLHEMIDDYGLKADDICMSAVINAHSKAGDREGAVKYLDMMINDLGLSPNAITMTTVISAHSKAGDKEGAVKFLHMMIYELGLTPNDVTMNAVINAHSQSGDREGAAHYMNVMVNELGLHPDAITLSAMINACAQNGDKEGAVKYLNMMRHELNLVPTDIAMSAVINAHARACDPIGAVKYFDMMIHELGLRPDAITLNEIINAHALSGDKENAVRFLHIMKDQLGLVPDSISMNTVLKAIVTSRSGFVFEEIMEQLDIMRSLGIRLDSYSYPVLFMACERKKDRGRCLAWLDEMLGNRVGLNSRSMKIVCDICQRVLGTAIFNEYKMRREADFQACLLIRPGGGHNSGSQQGGNHPKHANHYSYNRNINNHNGNNRMSPGNRQQPQAAAQRFPYGNNQSPVSVSGFVLSPYNTSGHSANESPYQMNTHINAVQKPAYHRQQPQRAMSSQHNTGTSASLTPLQNMSGAMNTNGYGGYYPSPSGYGANSNTPSNGYRVPLFAKKTPNVYPSPVQQQYGGLSSWAQ